MDKWVVFVESIGYWSYFDRRGSEFGMRFSFIGLLGVGRVFG